MLPDFPKSRKELRERLLYLMKMRVQEVSVFASMGQQFTQHEGRGFTYEQVTDEGKRTVESGFEELRMPMEFRLADVPKFVDEVRLAKLREYADDIARQQSKLAYKVLDEASERAGTAIDAGGQPLTKELFLKSEEVREMDFDPVTGKVEGVYIAHPDTAAAMHRWWQEWEQDKEFMKKVNEIRARKYEEWRDRESRRKLVN